MKKADTVKNPTVKFLPPLERNARKFLNHPVGARDVEIIINNLLDMGRYQSMKMYNYGAFFTEKQNQQ